MLPVLRVGPLAIQVPGLALLAGLWIALNMIEREALRVKVDSESIIKTVSIALVAGLIGGRLFFVAQHSQFYLQNPLGLISFDAATFNRYGAAATAGIVAFAAGRRLKLRLRPSLDALVPGLAAMMVALAASHLLSGNADGSPTNLPWGIELSGQIRHPTQVYELLAALAVYIAWRHLSSDLHTSGVPFLHWLSMQTGAIIFLEAFRGDSIVLPGGFRQGQVIGLAVLLVCFAVAWAWKTSETVNVQQPAGAAARRGTEVGREEKPDRDRGKGRGTR